jgi:hypothetical protein
MSWEMSALVTETRSPLRAETPAKSCGMSPVKMSIWERTACILERLVAPSAFVRIPSRSHLVGAVYANRFQIEPQSTVSQEPRATEISHSEEHFGPFFEPGVFRYASQLPLSASAIEMFVYADNAQFKVNGETSTIVELPSSNVTANISLTRNMISGFPAEAFSSKLCIQLYQECKLPYLLESADPVQAGLRRYYCGDGRG